VNSAAGGGSIGLSAGSTGTVTVTGPGSIWNNSPGGGLNIGSFGTGTLTIANGGAVINDTAFAANIGNGASGVGMVTVTGAGSAWSNSSGVNIGNSGAGTLTIADGGVVTGLAPIVIAANAGAIGTFNIGAAAGSPAAAPGTLTAPSVVFGAGTGTINFNHTSTDYVFAPAISGNGTVNVLAGVTTFTGANSYSGATNVDAGTLRAGALNTFSPNSPVRVAGGGTLDLNGFSQAESSLTDAGLVNMGAGAAPGTVLTTTSYTGSAGTMAINTLLGGDGSPSDRLVINGGAGNGATTMHVTNAGGSGAETTGNGILVVEAINGATTSAGAFALPTGELRGGVTKKPAAVPTKKLGPAPCPLFSPSVWGRFFGQTLDNHYRAFADPRASGNLGGFQGGIDLLRGSLIAGHSERAGLYGAYGDVNADVDGLVTNPAATAYVLSRTGSMNLNSWSAGGYWTHVGPGGWYLDAMLQGTWYYVLGQHPVREA
jgi:T5SS/PEP-CTERM-associated repeat protein/autotransporter-associated beta strand protein